MAFNATNHQLYEKDDISSIFKSLNLIKISASPDCTQDGPIWVCKSAKHLAKSTAASPMKNFLKSPERKTSGYHLPNAEGTDQIYN